MTHLLAAIQLPDVPTWLNVVFIAAIGILALIFIGYLITIASKRIIWLKRRREFRRWTEAKEVYDSLTEEERHRLDGLEPTARKEELKKKIKEVRSDKRPRDFSGSGTDSDSVILDTLMFYWIVDGFSTPSYVSESVSGSYGFSEGSDGSFGDFIFSDMGGGDFGGGGFDLDF